MPGMQPDDHNRSIALRTFSRLLDADATIISIRKETKPEDKTALREMTGMIDMTGHLGDFAETLRCSAASTSSSPSRPASPT
jgi:hypothetical protein